MASATQNHWQWPLRFERFSAPLPVRIAGEPVTVHCAESKHLFTYDSQRSLLDAAEASGLTPPSGCRTGICRSCLCKKRQGSVLNLITGQRSTQPDEWIQLCISVPETDLELAL